MQPDRGPGTTKHREGFAIVWQPSNTGSVTLFAHQCKVTENKEHICLQTFPVAHSGAALTSHLSVSADRSLFAGFQTRHFQGPGLP